MTVRMLFFAHLRDLAGGSELELTLPAGGTVREAVSELAARLPRLEAVLDHARVAVNAELAGPETLLHEGDEVALMPPMSGGTDA